MMLLLGKAYCGFYYPHLLRTKKNIDISLFIYVNYLVEKEE
jgi:hypothetical protein